MTPLRPVGIGELGDLLHGEDRGAVLVGVESLGGGRQLGPHVGVSEDRSTMASTEGLPDSQKVLSAVAGCRNDVHSPGVDTNKQGRISLGGSPLVESGDSDGSCEI